MVSKRPDPQTVQQIQEGLRDLVWALDGLNQAVGAQVALRPVDLEVLDTVARSGPTPPSQLAEILGIHPATLTGILDRLEEGGWAERITDPSDRRRVLIRALRDRGTELRRLYAPMARHLTEICARFSPSDLEAIRHFLESSAEAARKARPRRSSAQEKG